MPEVQRLARENNFQLSSFQNPYATLLVAAREKTTSQVHIYIEGDGVAWLTEQEPSLDPTPVSPTGMRLAILDQSDATVIYLSRPGQYVESPNLSVWDWTHRRFSPETMRLYGAYLDQVRTRFPKAEITILGYSGGATIALLLAAQRMDIAQVITFAGLLDPEKWVAIKGYSPLEGSLNPVTFADRLSHIPQVHLTGKEDSVVLPPVVENYRKHLSPATLLLFCGVEGVSHWQGWEDIWQAIGKKILGGGLSPFPQEGVPGLSCSP